jgi:hypothetical protein
MKIITIEEQLSVFVWSLSSTHLRIPSQFKYRDSIILGCDAYLQNYQQVTRTGPELHLPAT